MLNNFDGKAFNNIGFKVGPQANIDTLLGKGTAANAIPGVFYFAGDTNRLYIGQSDKSIAAVNQGVVTVASIKDLPKTETSAEKMAAAGNFYYVTELNALCVYNGHSSQWTQLNPDTAIVDAGVDATEDTSKNQVTVSAFLENSNTGKPQGEKSFIFNPIEFVGGDNVSITLSEGTATGKGGIDSNGDPKPNKAKKITINGKVYILATSQEGTAAKIQIEDGNDIHIDRGEAFVKEEGANPSNIDIKVDSDSGKIFLSAKDTELKGFKATAEPEGYKFDITTNFSNTTPAVSTTLNPQIKAGSHIVSFKDNIADLTKKVITFEEFEDKLKIVNHMRYRGTIPGSAADTLTGTEVGSYELRKGGVLVSLSIGDMLVVSAPGTISLNESTYLTTGTILIAKGEEDGNGNITKKSLDFDVIASTVNTDTQFRFLVSPDGKGKTVELRTGTGKGVDGAVVGSLNIDSVDPLITVAGDPTVDNNANFKITHEAPVLTTEEQSASGTQTENKQSGLLTQYPVSPEDAKKYREGLREITVRVPEPHFDDKGHFKYYTYIDHVIQDHSHEIAKGLKTTTTTSLSENVANQNTKLEFKLKDEVVATHNFTHKITSENLTVTAPDNQTMINFKWGTF